jgi:serine/threonine protein phosphatase PrpC
MFEIYSSTDTTNFENQDSVAIIEHSIRGSKFLRAKTLTSKGFLLMVADGAGGMGGGYDAAELATQIIIKETTLSETDFLNPLIYCSILEKIDNQLLTHPIAGETTAVIVAVSDKGVCGASVGDSGAFLIQEKTEIELTAHQRKKPLLGSGIIIPAPFGVVPLRGTLLLATDGLIKYATPDKIRQIILNNNPKQAAKALIESVRYPSSNLPDDVTVIVMKIKTR